MRVLLRGTLNLLLANCLLTACTMSNSPDLPQQKSSMDPGGSNVTPVPTDSVIPVAPQPDTNYLDRNQSLSDMDGVLADKKPHAISVLFKDTYKIRVRPGKGQTRDAFGNGFETLGGDETVLSTLERVIGQYSFSKISPSSMTQGKSEDELAKTEVEMSNLLGVDAPNNGSWAYFELKDFTPEAAKKLTVELQNLNMVRNAAIIPNQ